MREKMKFHMPSAFTTLIMISIVIAILTWVVPAGEYITQDDGTKLYQRIDPHPQGLWDIIAAPIAGFFSAKDVSLFILVIGGFIGITMKTGALEAGVQSLLRKLKDRENLLIPILMILFSIGGSTFGMAEETIAFYPLLVPVFLLAGYDVVVAVMVIILGAGVGVLGSTINPFATGVASDAAGVAISDGLGIRLVIYVCVVAAAIVFTMVYAAKVKKDKSKSIVADLYDQHYTHFVGSNSGAEQRELSGRDHFVLGLFGFTFVMMMLAVIPWAYKFDIPFFENIYNWFAQFRIFGFDPTSSDNYLGTDTSSASIGDWWFGQLSVWFLLMAVIIGKVHGMKEKDLVQTFLNGAKDLLGVALIVGVSRGIKVVMDAGGMSATLLHASAEALNNLGPAVFINLTYLFYLPMSFLIPSTSGLAGASIPIMGPLGDIIGAGAANVITAYQSASGVINLVTPTSGVVMGGLLLAQVPYERWLKHLLKFLGVLSLIVMLMLSLAVAFG